MGHQPDPDETHTGPPVHDGESALVARVRTGDVQAFSVLVQLYVSRLARFAMTHLGSYDMAQDVVQSVFVQVWEHRTSLDPARPVKAYLFRAVRNRILDEQKAAAVRERYAVHMQRDLTEENAEAVVPDSEHTILDAETVQAALRQLPERRQMALRLRFEEEMTHAEIAEVLGVSAEAAQRLVSRAVAELRVILGAAD